MKAIETIKFKHLLTLAIMFSIFLYSCGGGSKTGNDSNNKDSVAQTDSIVPQQDKAKNTFYKIPSPAELFAFLKQEKTVFNANALNKKENVSKYNTTDAKALNFGIYTADLAYCSMFEKNQLTASYYVTVKQIADDLGLVEGFDQNITQRFENNIQNNDSLYQIANEAYWTAYSFLEHEDKTNILPYIIIGNWIESVHITLQSIDKFAPDDRIVQRIADQDLIIDNLLAYLNLVENKNEIEDYIQKLKIILKTFEERYDNDKKELSKELFEKIKNKVGSLRNEFIK